MGIHTTHPDVIKRLKRANGHLESVIEMIESGEKCVRVAQQLQAVEAAVGKAKKVFIHDHIDHCLDDAVHSKKKTSRHELGEFKEITKYL